MKKIKVILIAAFFVSGICAEAQSIGLRAGVNFTNINGEDASGEKLENKLRPGFHGGVVVDIKVAPEFDFQPGLLFSQKGANNDMSTTETKVRTNWIELPLNLLYKPVLGKGRLIAGFGPYVAFGVSGDVENGENTAKIKFQKEAGTDITVYYHKPLDAGANFVFGYEFSNKLSAQLNAQLGLTNLNAYNNDAKLKNTGFGLSLGYRFK